MKKYAMLALTAIFMVSMVTMAQDQTPTPPTPPANRGEFRQGGNQQFSAEQRVERLAKDISLTDEQKVKVKALYEKYDADFTKLRTEGNREDPGFREKMKALRDAQDKELEAIIGTENAQKLKQIRAERMKNRENR